MAPLLLPAAGLPPPEVDGPERNFSMCLIRSATEMMGFSMFCTWGTTGAVGTGSGCSSERLRMRAAAAVESRESERSPKERRLAGESVLRIERCRSSESEVSSRLLLRDDLRMGRISSDSEEYFFLRIGLGAGWCWESDLRMGRISWSSWSRSMSWQISAAARMTACEMDTCLGCSLGVEVEEESVFFLRMPCEIGALTAVVLPVQVVAAEETSSLDS
uniref:(northern house mosquito) hypothetical protein n=1 Tax=Culex pipiens TaxID=7175 RepID=A0A8D8BND2_CULPI